MQTPRVIITKFLAPTNTRGARMRAVCGAHRSPMIGYDHEWTLETNHRHAASVLATELGLREAPVSAPVGEGGDPDYVHVYAPMANALARLAAWCISGDRYQVRNPYAVPQIRDALQALSLNAGYIGVPDELLTSAAQPEPSPARRGWHAEMAAAAEAVVQLEPFSPRRHLHAPGAARSAPVAIVRPEFTEAAIWRPELVLYQGRFGSTSGPLDAPLVMPAGSARSIGAFGYLSPTIFRREG